MNKLLSKLTLPLALLPPWLLHRLGKSLGSMAYYTFPRYRKRTLSNIALASELNLDSAAIVSLAKKSLQNFVITGLEYPKLAYEKDITRLATIENHEIAEAITQQGKSIIFFGGHQANWEILFLAITQRMPGVAIGRPLGNKSLYNWVIKMREKNGGKIIPPYHAIKEGLRALKQGLFLGVVGDQGMPKSNYSSSFLGRRAFTSPLPALLSYRTGSPIVVTTIKRINDHYFIHYSDPIWPNMDAVLEVEVERMMGKTLEFLANSIKEMPEQWLWQHNRWKQKTDRRVKITYRQESLLLILPEQCEAFLPHIKTLRELYPLAFLTLMLPTTQADFPIDSDMEKIIYQDLNECFIEDYRFKLVFNFTRNNKFNKHFKGLSAFYVFSMPNADKITFSEIRNHKK